VSLVAFLRSMFRPPARHPGEDQREAHQTQVEALAEAAEARRAHQYAAARAYLGVAHRCSLFLGETAYVLP